MGAFITSMGRFLPGEPIDNESMEEYLGKINGKPSRARRRVLKQNGIETRYYAIDRQQQTLISNAEMAARAVRCALERGRHDLAAVDVIKRRSKFAFDQCTAEFAEVEIAGGANSETIEFESEDPAAVLRAIAKFGLTAYPNISYVRHLKLMIGMIPLASGTAAY